MRCPKHRGYKGIYPPRVECDACWEIYLYPDDEEKEDRKKRKRKKFDDEKED